MASDLNRLGVAEAAARLAAGDCSAVELVEACIAAQEAAANLNAVVADTAERACAAARHADQRRHRNEARPLEGIPVAVKDIFCTRGVATTAGSRILDGFVPEYESTVSAKLWDAGAILLGKTNMDEFAMGSSNETSWWGPVRNPWSPADGRSLVPGGSSGGSAAIVAAHAVPAALGTDTGGSIRQPASFCGVVGLKPTYGRCSRWGIIAFASSLDQAGPLTRSVADAALILQHIAGFDPKDSTSADLPVPDLHSALQGDVKGLRVGIPAEYRLDTLPVAVGDLWEQGIAWFRAAGAELRDVSLPHTRYALPAYYIVAPAEASANLARYDGVRFGLRSAGKDPDELYTRTRREGFGEEVRRRIMIGGYVLSEGYYDAYYLRAQQVRTRIAEDFRTAFREVDVLLTPTAPSSAFPEGAKTDDPLAMYVNDIFTVPASLAGLPAISVPAGLDDDRLPLGLQLIGQAFDEATLLRAAAALENAVGTLPAPAVSA